MQRGVERIVRKSPISSRFVRLMGVGAAACAGLLYAPAAVANENAGLPSSLGLAKKDAVLVDTEVLRYRGILNAIRQGRWEEARRMLRTDKPGILDHYLLAELYLAPKSPVVAGADVQALLRAAPDLPQAQRLSALLKRRGIDDAPALPNAASLRWLGESPRRYAGRATEGDAASADLLRRARPLIRENRASDAEALFTAAQSRLSPNGTIEWQQRLAWAYFTENRDGDALRLARLAATGDSDWAVQAQWTVGLLHWRAQAYADAAASFDALATRGIRDNEMISAALYWAARAHQAAGNPQAVQSRLRQAAQFDQGFYGLLAAEALGIPHAPSAPVAALPGNQNMRIAVALSEIGEQAAADQMIRFQARIGDAGEHDDLVRLAGQINLPQTQYFLAHNGQRGAKLDRFARFPAPKWQPLAGWRVDPALVFAHGLQESGFDIDASSPAGAKGVMQVLPSTARYMGGKASATTASTNLFDPAVNLEYGQSYLEYLARNPVTGAQLPKVIAAYNAGLTPVGRWNTQIVQQDDPLLYIESIPFWETRGYVVAVLRNYWMYQEQSGAPMVSRAALAANRWPDFPANRNVRSPLNIVAAGR